MDFKEKLEKAAKREAYDNSDRSYNDRRDGFIQGAEWLQSQPLADRLTEEEREKIVNLFNMYNNKYWANNEEESYGAQLVCSIFEQIFGKEMFENE